MTYEQLKDINEFIDEFNSKTCDGGKLPFAVEIVFHPNLKFNFIMKGEIELAMGTKSYYITLKCDDVPMFTMVSFIDFGYVSDESSTKLIFDCMDFTGRKFTFKLMAR